MLCALLAVVEHSLCNARLGRGRRSGQGVMIQQRLDVGHALAHAQVIYAEGISVFPGQMSRMPPGSPISPAGAGSTVASARASGSICSANSAASASRAASASFTALIARPAG
jgi:hypothetical protein